MPPSGTAGNLKRPRRPLILVFAGKKEKRLHVGFTSGSVLFESLSQSLELVKIGTEEAINSEMENQFHEFLEECVAVDGPGRIGHYVRKILAIARGGRPPVFRVTPRCIRGADGRSLPPMD